MSDSHSENDFAEAHRPLRPTSMLLNVEQKKNDLPTFGQQDSDPKDERKASIILDAKSESASSEEPLPNQVVAEKSPRKITELMATIQTNYRKKRASKAIEIGPDELQQTHQQSQDDEDTESLTSQLSDLSYQSRDYHTTQQDSSTPSVKKYQSSTMSDSVKAGIGEGFLDKLTQQRQIKIDDILDIVAISEEAYHVNALQKLKESKAMTMQTCKLLTAQHKQTMQVQRVLNGPLLLKQITQSLQKRSQENIRATCITVSEVSLVIGATNGFVFVYERDSEKFHSHFQEAGKESVTAVDVHPKRTKFVIIGNQKGLLTLVNITKLAQQPQAFIKQIKDSHKSAIVSVKFCDLREERNQDDKQQWMICSCDVDGKVLVQRIQSVAFGYYTVEKIGVVDATKGTQVRTQILASRFFDRQYPKDELNDSLSIIAIGSIDEVLVQVIEEQRTQKVFKVMRPKVYPSENLNRIAPLAKELPCLAWGYGRTPGSNLQAETLLAIAWGPLIQIAVLKDIRKSFHMDGYYFVAPATEYKQNLEQKVEDPQIQSIHFLDESLLVVTLNTSDVRVLYTKEFYPGKYEQPASEITIFSTADSRKKMVALGTPLTKEQQLIELERRTYLESAIQTSFFGANASQMVAVGNGYLVLLTTGGIYKLWHQTWEESLGKLGPEAIQGANWIDVLTKALEIYLGKVKGLRGVPDNDELRCHMMKGLIKLKIGEIMEQVILGWRYQASNDLKQGKNAETVKASINRNLQTLVRIIIELTVEISEADFLFTDVYQRFKDLNCGEMFSTEIKPYILSGLFATWMAPEHILNFHILQHHQAIFLEAHHGHNTSPTSGIMESRHVSPAESFEKVLISLRFDSCSRTNINETIEFCKKYRLATGAMHLCVSTMGEKGPVEALKLLKDFYSETLNEEITKQKISTLQDIQSLVNVGANSAERVPLERCAFYLGLKLVWAAKLFIKGKKFPKGAFDADTWPKVCVSVLQKMLEPQFIEVMTSIDAGAFFQILSLPFSQENPQYEFLQGSKQGGHQQLLTIITSHCMIQAKGSSARNGYLCFIANIVQEFPMLKQYDRLFFFGITLELLQSSEDLVIFNDRQLKTQKNRKNWSKRLKEAPAEFRAHILSEEQLILLMRKSEHLTSDNINELVQAMEDTQFKHLKLILYEKQEDYLKCLQMQIENAIEKNQPLTSEDQDCFTWIIKVYDALQSRVKDGESTNKDKFLHFHREILSSLHRLIQIDAFKTVGLCDAIFKSDHAQMIQRLIEHQQAQYDYIKKLIELKSDEIKRCVRQFTLHKQLEFEQRANQWTKILGLHMRLTSKLEPSQVVSLVKLIVRDSCYPLEECLRICREAGHTEASAILCEEIGDYPQSIGLYLEFLAEAIDWRQLRKELFYGKTHSKRDRLPQMRQFEYIFSRIDIIQQMHPEEVLIQTDACWQRILETISELLGKKVFNKKTYCKRYFFDRLQTSCRQLLGHVTFDHIISSYLKIQPHLKYNQLHAIVSEVFLDRKSEIKMCGTAAELVVIECKQMEELFQCNLKQGLKFRSIKCSLCLKHIQEVKQQVLIFECNHANFNHTYHTDCVKGWLKQEQNRDKKALSDTRPFRCPICCANNNDIFTDKKALVAEQQRAKSNSEKSSQSASSNDKPAPTETMLRRAQAEKAHKMSEMRVMERQKRMKIFDQTTQTLSKGDFQL